MEFESTVVEFHAGGTPICRSPDGRICFTDWGWPGEVLRLRVTHEKKNYVWAKTLEVLKASEHRRSSPCPHFGRQSGQCGGCSWSDMVESEQLRQKQLRVESAIHRIAPEARVSQIWGSEQSWGYRNRVQLKVSENQIGFVSAGTKILAPIDSCMVCTDRLQRQIQALHRRLPNSDWKPTPPYLWNFLDLDDGQDLENLKINVRAPFRQGNSSQNSRMQQWLLGEPFESEVLLELFAGSGNFTKILSQRCQNIFAVEIQKTAVLQLREISGVRVYEKNLFNAREVHDLVKSLPSYDALFLDPPREGAPELGSFLRDSLRTVLYVSCDLMSFLRDAKLLLRSGFLLRSIQPVDLFPQTPHVELLAKFER